ncbi:unnamed protein product, partial [Medioppia subpectinata]
MSSETMFWFKGSVNEAINKSRAERKLFVVFINGTDDISAKMNGLYESLSHLLCELPLIAIKLEAQSDNCNLFSQIYPVIVIPSTYFIDSNGVAIEIIGGSVDDQNVLLQRIHKTIDIYNQSLSSSVTQNTTQSNDNERAKSEPVSQVSNTREPTPESTPSAPATASSSSAVASVESERPSLDSKVERANQLIEAIRQKKAKEEEEREKADEIERRKGMKEMLSAKRLREDKEKMDIVKEREREKRAEKLARERVLAQIAADREDRKARQMTFTDSTESKTTEPNDANSSQSSPKEPEVRQRMDKTARIQFRLPDGSTRNNVFEATDSLEVVKQYVSSNLNIRGFTLSTSYPRREFGTNDYNQSLRDLSLSPSSVLLVVPNSGIISSRALTSQSYIWQILTYLMSPLVM